MMAAIWAAQRGHEVHLFEKNEKLGKKLYITGKGRCNITNACEMNELFDGILSNYPFLYSAFYHMNNQEVMAFFEARGVPLTVERGHRVFPQSNHSSDVIGALSRELKAQGVKVHFNTEVKKILVDEESAQVRGIQLPGRQEIELEACIVATGGLTYSGTGSTGDGYTFAKAMGHQVTPLYPGLVPIEVKEEDVKSLQGLSLRNVKVSIYPLLSEDGFLYNKKRLLAQEFGEMLFTHFGLSGPIILSASSVIGQDLMKGYLALILDLKPALSFEQLDQRIRREILENPNRAFKNGIRKLFPSTLTPVMIHRSGIDPDKQMNSVTKEERQHLVNIIKHFTITLTALRPINEGIITKGGVNVKEIDPRTTESKLVKNLYFVGEVLDLDGVTGGFNLQIAWSTGALAGASVK